MSHLYRSRPVAGHAVNTEMTGAVPTVRGPRDGRPYATDGVLPVNILDPSTALARVPTRTMTMRVNAAPRMDLGLSRTSKGRY